MSNLKESIIDIYGANVPNVNSIDQTFSYSNKSWCDAKDYTGIWRVGRVRKSGDNLVIVNFDGWSDKWKQTYCRHSELLAPLRTHTIGYTGQKKVTLRDFEFNLETMQKMDKKLKLFMNDEKLNSFEPLEITTFIRGDLFILVDSILTLNERLDAKFALQICGFLNNIVILGVKWMNIAVTNHRIVTKFIGFEKSDYKDDVRAKYIHIHHKATAIYLAGFELLQSLKSIFKCDRRCSAFYQNNTITVSPRQAITTFLNAGALHKLNDLINFEDQGAKGKLKRIEFEMLWPLICCVPKIYNENKDLYYSKESHIFLFNMFHRLKYEIDLDPDFRVRYFENDPEFREFIDELRKIHYSHNSHQPFIIDSLLFGDEQSDIDYQYETMNTEQNTEFLKKNPFEPDELCETESLNIISSIIEQEKEPVAPRRKKPEGVRFKFEHLVDDQKASKADSTDVSDLRKKCESLEKELAQLTKRVSGMGKETKSPPKSDRFDRQKPEKRDLEELLGTGGLNVEELLSTVSVLKQFNSMLNKDSEPKLSVKDKHREYNSALDLDVQKMFKGSEIKSFDFGTSEDELKTLTAVEFLISENKILEAIKLIKWRKKIIKLAHLNGWDVAKIIAKNTIGKLDITAGDIIISNLCFLQQNEHVIGLRAVGGEESEEN